MATAENVPAAENKKTSKPKKSPQERRESRSDLLTLLLIILVGVGILYLGLSVGWFLVSLVLMVVGRVVGIGV
jgi:hypothetical protein